MKILITGGAGFIGSHTVESMVHRGHQVTVFDDFNDFYRPDIKRANLAEVQDKIALVEGDIRDKEKVTRLLHDGEFDTVIHLASRAGVRPSIKEPELYLSTNIGGTFNVLEASRNTGVERLIFASSSSVYGLNKNPPFSESDLIDRTISPYATSKLAAEQLCSNYAHLYGLRVVCLRFFTVYGPRQRPDLAISKFTRLIDEGHPIEQYGDGTTSRDYTYIDDIVQGVEGALLYDGPKFEIFNLGGSQTVTLKELIQTVEAAVGKKAVINQLPEQPGDLPFTSADVSKARKLLGYEPRTPVSEGVPKYVEWFMSHKPTLEESTAVV